MCLYQNDIINDPKIWYEEKAGTTRKKVTFDTFEWHFDRFIYSVEVFAYTDAFKIKMKQISIRLMYIFVYWFHWPIISIYQRFRTIRIPKLLSHRNRRFPSSSLHLSLTHTASFFSVTLLPLAYRQQLKTDTFYPKLFTACLDPRVYECFMWPIVRSVGRSVCRIPFFSSFEWIFPFGTNNKPILTSYFIHIINIIYDIECMQSATCLPFQSGGISYKTHRANPIDSSRPRLWCERLEFFMFHVCSCWVLLEWFLFCSFITNDRIGSGYPSLFFSILSILLFSTSSGVCFFFGWNSLSVNFSISLSKHFLFLHICVQALFCCYRGLLLVVFDVHGHHRIYQ